MQVQPQTGSPRLPATARSLSSIAATVTSILLLSVFSVQAWAQQQCGRPELGISSLEILGPMVPRQPVDLTLLRDMALSNARREGYPDYLEFGTELLVDSRNARTMYCYDPRREVGHMFWMRPGCTSIVISDRRDGSIRRLIRDCAGALHGFTEITPGARMAHEVHARHGEPLERLVRIPENRRDAIQDYLVGVN